MDYLYDGSFDGFLTCVYYSFKTSRAVGIYEKCSYQASLINKSSIIETDIKLSDIVYNAIEKKIGKEAMRLIYNSFLSCCNDKEIQILNFIEFGFKRGRIVVDMYSHDYVLPVMQMSKKVGTEAHRILGLLRFAEIDGILYAKYSPDNNITPLIVDHFADRYKYEKFIIHDEKRKIAAVYSNLKREFVDASNINIGELSGDEIMVQNLWKSYFDTLTIDERVNPELQFQLVPMRYRKYIPEFSIIQTKQH